MIDTSKPKPMEEPDPVQPCRSNFENDTIQDNFRSQLNAQKSLLESRLNSMIASTGKEQKSDAPTLVNTSSTTKETDAGIKASPLLTVTLLQKRNSQITGKEVNLEPADKAQMTTLSKARADQQWISIWTFVEWVWERIFSKSGVLIYFGLTYAAWIGIWKDSLTGFSLFTYGLVGPIVFFFGLFLLNFFCAPAHIFTEFLMSKMFKNPQPTNKFHRLVFFLINLLVLPIVILILGGGGDVDLKRLSIIP